MANPFQPGDLVRGFARLFSWPVAERSIIVEGEHDQRYFALADRLYTGHTGLRLLGSRTACFPTGIGEEGGVFGIQRHFHPLRAIMDRDLTPDGKKVFHAIALFDDDNEGRRGFGSLTGQHLNYRRWRDVFLLKRILPRTTRDLNELTRVIDKENERWKGMDCTIEDLLSVRMVKLFIDEHLSAMARPVEQREGGFHCNLKPEFKARFIRFVDANATLEDVAALVDLIKSLRYHLGLKPDGDER